MNTTHVVPTRKVRLPQALRKCTLLLALCSFSLAITTLQAQTVSLKSQPVRITVPRGVASNVVATVTITMAGTFTTGVNFAVTGVPAGCTSTLSTNTISVAGTHTATLNFSSPTTLAQGDYDLAIEATGEASYRLPVPVNCSYVWSGSAGTAWSTPANWLGGVLPGESDGVVFGNLGGTTSNPTPTNLVVSADTTVSSIRFAQDQSNGTKAYNIEVQSGAKLSATGTGGFSMLRDAKVPQAAQTMDLKISGAGSFIVNNDAANFANHIDGQLNATLDMRDLNYFYAQVNRLPFGDYRAYPNFFTNGWAGGGTGNEVSRFAPQIYLAKTNVIKAAYVDPNNYNDLGERNYALTIGNYSLQGTTANLRFSFGNTNAFFLDSICFSQALQGGSGHNYNFWSTNSVAVFRGTGGDSSRMSVFAIADAASPAPPGNANVRGQVNFANQANTSVDALVDRLWLAIDRTNNNGQMTLQATLTYSNGVFDVNDAFLGYQRSGNNQGAAASTGFAGPEGTVTLNGSAVLRVNRDLNLGYTTASAPAGTTSPERAFGKVLINQSAVCLASNIVVGGVTKLSTNNVIVVNAGKLIVTNAIGAADARLANLTATNGGQIALHGVKVGETNIHVVTLTAPLVGPASSIVIPSIGNLGALPVTIPLISYVTDSPAFNGLNIIPPAGLYLRSIIDNNVSRTIEVTFSDVAPQLLVWQGGVNSNWSTNTADKNWLTFAGSVQTNFTDGDSVIFDDTASGSPSITVVDTVTPGQTVAQFGLVVSNSVKNYTFDGSSVLGGATLKKVGSGSLTINAPFSPGVILTSGSLTGAGSIGSTLLENGTTMTGFSGSIGGGLASSNANVIISASVSGGLALRAGSLLNNGTISGPITLAGGTTLNNSGVGIMNVILPWTVPTNSTLINNGAIVQSGVVNGNQGLTVNGTLSGVGKITQSGTQLPSDVRVTMGAGGTLQIGNTPGEITNNIIAVRLDFLAGSTTTVDVDNSTLALDKIFLKDGFITGKVNFGAGNNLGGRFLINKTAGPEFNLATTLNPFDLANNQPDNQQQAIPQVIPAPAAGLSWDVSRVVSNLTVAVISPPFMTNTVSGTNLVFEWPETYRGWRLERQTNSLAIGLAWNSTNWTSLVTSFAGSYSNANVVIDANTNILYFRSVQPIIRTNPTVFYRLTYP